ncbi:MAG: cation transporter [Bacteriovoracaceae bacterium]|nr:cation transporter [Bacteriovoracaceae bacterium]
MQQNDNTCSIFLQQKYCLVGAMRKQSASSCRSRVISLSLVANILLALVKGVIGYLASSQVLIADSIHSLIDSLSLIINFLGLGENDKISTKKALAISGIIAIFTFVTGVWVLADNISILVQGNLFRPGLLGVPVAFCAILLNWYLWHASQCASKQHSDVNIFICVVQNKTNLWASIISLGGLILADLGFTASDPISASIIGILMLKGALEIFNHEFSANTYLILDLKKKVIFSTLLISVYIVAFIAHSTNAILHTKNNILIPAMAPSSDAIMDDLLGRAHFHIIFDIQSNTFNPLPNNARTYRGDVSANLVALVKKHNIGVVIAKRIGDEIYTKLSDMNVQMYYVGDKDQPSISVYTAYKQYMSQALKLAASSNANKRHGKNQRRWLRRW